MAIFNLGSINAYLSYSVDALPEPGETISAHSVSRGLGGKGTNMSVAAARAAAHVVHIGAVGRDGDWAIERLTEYGVDTRHITYGSATGHAIIMVDRLGENAIIIHSGANLEITESAIGAALGQSSTGDYFLAQNETNMQLEAARLAKKLGLKVVYAAAPFNVDAVQKMLPMVDILVLNQIEADQLQKATGRPPQNLGVAQVIVTLGAKGCRWFNAETEVSKVFDAEPVEAVDTTGAGDTFTGYLVAGLDRGLAMEQALKLASRAGAIMVTRHGTADVIPDLKDIQDRFGP